MKTSTNAAVLAGLSLICGNWLGAALIGTAALVIFVAEEIRGSRN